MAILSIACLIRAGDRLLWHLPVVRPLADVLAKIDPDVVHAHMAGLYAGAALRSGCPAAITLHGVVFREAALALAHSSAAHGLRWRLDALYERWVVRRAHDLIAISPYVAHEYRSLTTRPLPRDRKPGGRPIFQSRIWMEHSASPVLLCVARVIPRKDILTLLEAFAGCGRRYPTRFWRSPDKPTPILPIPRHVARLSSGWDWAAASAFWAAREATPCRLLCPR